MSRAFVKEDAEVVERSVRRRTPSGLPPGALNYLTAAGEAQLRAHLASLKTTPRPEVAAIEDLESILSSVTVVPPNPNPSAAVFGSQVTLELADGSYETYRLVGVDEVGFHPANLSWISPIGKALLGAEPGQRVLFPGEAKPTRRILKIE